MTIGLIIWHGCIFFFDAKTVGSPLIIGLVSQLFAVSPPASLVHVHTRLCLDSSLARLPFLTPFLYGPP
jgi:hypothetical protein